VLLRFNKPGDPAKYGGLTIVRDDGSTEYQASPAPAFYVHDLAHYAVESVLELTESFLSLVARGHRLGQISRTATEWLQGLPVEARQTEFMVSQLQSEVMGFAQGPIPDAAAFNEQVATGCRAKGLPPAREVTHEELSRARALLEETLNRWAQVPRGSALELRFPGSWLDRAPGPWRQNCGGELQSPRAASALAAGVGQNNRPATSSPLTNDPIS
jgi:hypothetical protein